MPPRTVLSMMLLIFSLIVFFIGAMEFMVSPMLNPLADAFRTTTDKATWLVSGYALAYALAAPIFGWLSDRINRRKLLRVSLLFLFLDGLALTIAPNLEIAISLRIFGGIASAALIPTIFALVAELFPPYKQASAMGIVMLGMTAGIAGGPIFAGVLTELFYWQVPFLVSAAGCFLLYVLSKKVLRKNYIPNQIDTLKTVHQTVTFQSLFQFGCQKNLIRPLIAKGFWNGTAVSAFILAGEVLRHHYDLGTGAVGISVSAFGIGLCLGNLSVSIVKYLNIRDECALLLAIVLLFITCSAFMLLPLFLLFSLVCLMLWGYTLGLAAPISTSILANRAKQDKGQILAISESLNNLTILFLLPIATMSLSQYGTAVTMMILGSCFIVAIVLTLKDLLVTLSLN
ncbi:MFS transporter [Xenorhabdus ehlersii]|uniref:Chloramphenicol/florfenicol exporter n=1 Tax=Xenorhabdus ehlersii TaxID=290111 RepID=A0A2D0IRZ5_9GAMM|nr:MFS transporter [Xenorhabdus ehlersii]PHM24624.1 chloramphenicol/florfenicol exporter [Xenorhabdus ehlersii]RKE91262.1 putative MFS family arabinose efflux permease [Xenorhabdus ehlersii]